MVKVKKNTSKTKAKATPSPPASPRGAAIGSPVSAAALKTKKKIKKKSLVSSPKSSPRTATVATCSTERKSPTRKRKNVSSPAASPKKTNGSSPTLSPIVVPSSSSATKAKKIIKKKKRKVLPPAPSSLKKATVKTTVPESDDEEDEVGESSVPAAAPNKQFLKVFVGNVPYTAEEASVRSIFEKCGDIAFFEMPLNDRFKPKGLAYITFTNEKSVNAALKLEGQDMGGRPLIVKLCTRDEAGGKGKDGKGKDKGAKGADAKGKSKGKGLSDATTAFIRGLPFHADEAAIRRHFEECGEIERMNMPKNAEGNFRGLAFVTFAAAEGFEAALKYDSSDFDGRTMYVSAAADGGKGKGKDSKGKGKGSKGKDKDNKGKSKDSKGEGRGY